MFFISPLHLILGICRLCHAFVAHAGGPGGVSAYFAYFMRWEDNVLYGTQEVLGNAAAVPYSYKHPFELVSNCLSAKGIQMLRPWRKDWWGHRTPSHALGRQFRYSLQFSIPSAHLTF